MKPPIPLKEVRVLVKELMSPLNFALPVALTKHFRKRQMERNITDPEFNNVLKKGCVKREMKPDNDHSAWRWAMEYRQVTIVFNFSKALNSLVLITCWRGAVPRKGDQ